MSNRVPLDNVEHQSLRVANIPSSDHAKVNQALVVPGEFEDVQREYPIFIRKDQDGRFVAVALLGLDKGENLFLVGDRWEARYIPASIRRYPGARGVVELLRRTGFRESRYVPVLGGLMAIHLARR